MSDLTILSNLIKDWTEKKPDLDVLTFVSINDQGDFVEETRTYQQLWDNGQRLAHWLKQKGMKSGDKFALVMANHPEFVDFMVASSILGTVFVPIDPRTKGDKLQYMLDFAECQGAVAGDYALNNVADVWFNGIDGKSEAIQQWVLPLYEGDTSVAKVLASNEPVTELPICSEDPNAPMQLLYTSGTTGDPKAIMSSHARFGVGGSVAQVLGIGPEDRPYTGLSLTHANAQIVTLGSILTHGLRGVISLKFTKSRLWDITREYGCTWFNLLGGMTTAIFAEPPLPSDRDNPVRIILSAGMPEAIWEEFAQRFDVKITEFYGAAEGGLTFNPEGIGPVGSCGRPPESMELKIFAKDDVSEVATGEPGQICFRNADGSTPVVEYYKNPSASEKKTQGGWLRMGDIGHVDENGWLYFHYRDGGGIRKNGDFINTASIEKALAKFPAIEDVFVYGQPSDSLAPGEKYINAAIVLNQSTNADDIFNYCEQTLDSNSVPDHLQILDSIPKTASEKPQERFLLEALVNEPEQVFTR